MPARMAACCILHKMPSIVGFAANRTGKRLVFVVRNPEGHHSWRPCRFRPQSSNRAGE